MSEPYKTKDTGEALALRMCGVAEDREPYALEVPGRENFEWWWVFEDSEQRESLSTAFYDAYRSDPEEICYRIARKIEYSEEITGEDLMQHINAFVRMRKDHHQRARFMDVFTEHPC
jgi:hypothetical protein